MTVSTVSTVRRVCVAAVAVALTGLIVRPQLSLSLALRGDDDAARSDTRAAWGHYERALLVDPDNGVAVDRLLFSALMAHDVPRLRLEIERASTYLRSHPSEAAVLADRALAYHVLHEYARASSDFALAGERTKDARALTFAALDARRADMKERSALLIRRAVRIAPSFIPARRALERSS